MCCYQMCSFSKNAQKVVSGRGLALAYDAPQVPSRLGRETPLGRGTLPPHTLPSTPTVPRLSGPQHKFLVTPMAYCVQV